MQCVLACQQCVLSGIYRGSSCDVTRIYASVNGASIQRMVVHAGLIDMNKVSSANQSIKNHHEFIGLFLKVFKNSQISTLEVSGQWLVVLTETAKLYPAPSRMNCSTIAQ